MASETDDPRAFKTWEDAFQYPIPVVRKLEQQLRSNAGENREKLRSLVGASYRDLLSTAEMIIDMEERMSSVEVQVARVSRNCNSRNLDRISRNAAKMHQHNRSRDVDRYTFASQLAVLRNCPVAISRSMDTQGGLLLPAKVLVIGRLLHKALLQASKKVEIVDHLKDKLRHLRERLLKRINENYLRKAYKSMEGSADDTAMLVETMCAYSIATASTPTYVLRHFLDVRKDNIIKSVQHEDGLKDRAVSALKLCIQTCLDTQTIFPRRLADALLKLKSQHLIQDPDIRALYELNLDIHDRWIGQEARYYTPQPRHDELHRSESERLLQAWSKEVIPLFLKGIQATLDKVDDLNQVAEIRQELVETWIGNGSRMAGVKSKNVLDDLRDMMNSRLENIMKSRAQGLKDVVASITTALSGPGPSEQMSEMSLWQSTAASTNLTNGAQSFKKTVINTYHGRNLPVLGVLETYDKWLESILEVKGIVKSMKEMRWDDPFTDEVDIDDSDDEFGDTRQILLSDDDPRLLEETTRDALQGALKTLGKHLAKIVAEVVEGEEESVEGSVIFLLRVFREISDRIPRLRLNDRSASLESPFGADILRPLNTSLATYVVDSPVVSYRKALQAATKRISRLDILWDGTPPLPSQPSPAAFRFLQQLVKTMSGFGSDLWAPDSVTVLKEIAYEGIERVWSEALVYEKTDSEGQQKTTDVEAEKADENATDENVIVPQNDSIAHRDERRQVRTKQLLFDVIFIQRFLHTTTALSGSSAILDGIHEVSGVNESEKKRLTDKAGEYARKTYLLFALLS